MRREMVENGVKFLRHPNVQATPLSERVSFLEQKGMTKEEIQEAIEQYQNDSTPTPMPTDAAPPAPVQVAHAVTTAAPVVMAAAAPVQQLVRRARLPTYVRVLLTISSVVGAATILGFVWSYMVQNGYFPWFRSSRRMIEAAREEKQEDEKAAAEKEATLLSSLESVSKAIQTQTDELTKLCASIDKKEDELTAKQHANKQIASTVAEQATVQAIAELKAEVSTLKSLLLAKQSEASAASNASSSAPVTSASTSVTSASAKLSAMQLSTPSVVVPPQPVVATETPAQRMQNALRKFRQENPMDQLKLASGILSMYVRNLVENPDVPRYRRIAPANANFKQKIEPLKHHDELLKAIGFESTGLNMEWKWHLLDRTNGEFDEHLAILKALLKALQAVSTAKSNDPLALEEIAQQSLDEFYKQREATNVETKSTEITTVASTEEGSATSTSSVHTERVVSSTTATSSVTAKADTDLQAFLSRLEQKTKPTTTAGKETTPVVDAEKPAVDRVLAAAAAVKEEAEDLEEKAPVPVEEETKTESGPAYPKSFMEVMEMLKKGETVPGIQEIEERISDDSAKFLSESNEDVASKAAVAVPAKPWEKR